METLGIVFTIIGITIPLLVIGVVIYIIVAVVKNKDNKVRFKLSAKTLLQIYLYVISFLTLGIAVIGGSTAIRAGLSYAFDIPFSYTLQKANSFAETKAYDPAIIEKDFEECYVGEATQYYGQDFCIDLTQRKTDLINGITLLVSMSILYAIHRYALSRIDKKIIIPWLEKIYTFGSLIAYSVVSIIAIPISIYNLTNFLLFEPSANMYSTPEAPAMAIAISILSIPLWIYFLRKTTQLNED